MPRLDFGPDGGPGKHNAQPTLSLLAILPANLPANLLVIIMISLLAIVALIQFVSRNEMRLGRAARATLRCLAAQHLRMVDVEIEKARQDVQREKARERGITTEDKRGITSGDLVKKLGVMWHELDPLAKEKYK
ncbi:hypothetical protein T492DRAFT_839646 [Pavlovales sp. CCMP2436]|nr:hypothetical protein T492DRAFT_839646 [Pavlovales sp. CCMP2436]